MSTIENNVQTLSRLQGEEAAIFFLLVDNLSHFIWFTLLTTKYKAEAAIRGLKVKIQVEKWHKLWLLHMDRDELFTMKKFTTYCAYKSIELQFTAPYLSQQKDVVERHN